MNNEVLAILDSLSQGSPRPEASAPKLKGKIKKPELMPKGFNEFVGQDRIKSMLKDSIISAQKRNAPIGHILLSGMPGQGKCIKEDTVLFTDRGIKEIGSLVKGNKNIQGLKMESYGIDKKNKVNHLYLNGVSDTIKITTRGGYSIEGTFNHPVLVLENMELKFKKLKDIKKNDIVPIGLGQNCFGNKIDIPNFIFKAGKHNYLNYDNITLPRKWSPELARVCGYLIGDGCVSGKNCRLFNADSFIINDFNSCIEKIFNYKCGIHKSRKGNYIRVSISNKKIKTFLRFIGIKNATAGKKEIPDSILCSSRIIISEFIKAYFACDGYIGKKNQPILEMVSLSDRLIKQIQIVLLNYGIISALKKKLVKDKYYSLLVIYGKYIIKFDDEIGLIETKRNYKTVKEILKKKRNPNYEVILNGRKMLVILKNEIKKIVSKLAKRGVTGGVYKNITQDKFKELVQFIRNKCLSIVNRTTFLAYDNFVFQSIVKIEHSKANTLDLVVPEEHYFFGNGFINHNTTLAYLIAEEARRPMVAVTGISLQKPMDMFNVFREISKLQNPILFIDEIHSIKKQIGEMLYLPMEIPDTVVRMPSTFGTINLETKIPALTVIGATAGQEGLLDKPLYDRFDLKIRLERYGTKDMVRICRQSSKKLDLEVMQDIAEEIASRSCITPRILNALLRRIRDFSVARDIKRISKRVLTDVFQQLALDELGIDNMGRGILKALAGNPRGSLGLRSLATMVGVDEITIKNIYEPQLILNNLVAYLPRGRSITEQGLKHIRKYLG